MANEFDYTFSVKRNNCGYSNFLVPSCPNIITEYIETEIFNIPILAIIMYRTKA